MPFSTSRDIAPTVLGQERIERLDRGGEETAPERCVRHEADAELAARGQHLLLDVPAPQRVFRFERRDRVHLVRAPDRLSARFRKREKAHFAALDEPRHRADRLFDRHRRIDAVQAVDVDVIDTEAFQALVAGLRHVIGMAAGERPAGRLATAPGEREIAELGPDEEALATAFDGLPDQLLVHAIAVGVGGDEKVHAQLERAVDRRQRLLVVGLAVADRHAHAAEPERGNFGTVATELACLQGITPVSRKGGPRRET